MLEQFIFEPSALKEVLAQLIQSDYILDPNGSGFIELASPVSNLWVDRYVDYVKNDYDHYIDGVQDRIVFNTGMPDGREGKLDAVDRLQWYLHHPEMRTDSRSWTDLQIKQVINDLLGIRG